VIEATLAQLLEMQSEAILGTVDESGVPDACRAWAVRLVPGGRIRAFVGDEEHRTLANLRPGGAVALTLTDVVTLRSIQAKGRAEAVEPVTEDDLRAVAAFTDRFFTAVHETDGTPVHLLERMRPHGYTAFVAHVDELFDQTPGPVAGARLAPR
jgi:hypothetical protein